MKIESIHKDLTRPIDRLFPRFGEKALDIPSWDEGKGMYLVDQYQAASGNRSLTYVGVSEQLLFELTLGHFHSWEFVNKARAMVYDGEKFRIICCHDWEQSTHFNKEEVRAEIALSLRGYVKESKTSEGMTDEEIADEINRILTDLFSRKVEDLDRKAIRKILVCYCSTRGICSDFTRDYEIQ